MSKVLGVVLLFVALALVPSNNKAKANGPETTITIVSESKRSGKDEKRTNQPGITTASVSWTISSYLRRITSPIWSNNWADDKSETFAICSGCVTEAVAVTGNIWKNGAKKFVCSASRSFTNGVPCDTQDVVLPGNMRGTGQHSYQASIGGRVDLPNSDTGVRWME